MAGKFDTVKCPLCQRDFIYNGLASHTKACMKKYANGIPLIKEKKKRLGTKPGHSKGTPKKITFGVWKCRYCQKEFITHYKRNGHETRCKKNKTTRTNLKNTSASLKIAWKKRKQMLKDSQIEVIDKENNKVNIIVRETI